MAFALGPRAISAGYRLAAFDNIGSTNAEAMSRARDGEAGPMWFVTSEQTAGRGRRHRPWIAPRGNLACSILDVIDVPSATAATLGFVAGLALEAALQKISLEASPMSARSDNMKFALKWPNDVLANSEKLAGVLLEAETVPGGLAVVTGIGVNVVAAPPGMPTPATSLAALGIRTSADAVFTALSDAWVEFRAIWNNGRGFDEIRTQWLKRAAGLGEKVAIQTGRSTLEGTFETLDETGHLMVRTTDGQLLPVAAGDVYFGSAASVGTA
jgi:BirA family biotin operon repressor/biotin-[acetyl-CoA-carboxylase] ligase